MMKQLLIMIVTAGALLMGGEMYAQPLTANTSPGEIVTGGKFNGSTIGTGSATPSSVSKRSRSVFPLYTKVDTVVNSGADTLYQQISSYCNSVYTWVNVTSISGTNTTCTVRLQATADNVTGNSNAVAWETIQTYTVSSTGNPYKVLINSGNGWPYTNMRWILSGAGTHSSSWYGGIMVR